MGRYAITDFVREYMANHIHEGDCCIDATAGKGNDTLFLWEKATKQGMVYSFDIQPEAVAKTKELLKEHDYPVHQVLCESHEKMAEYVEAGTVSAVMFNLGYLPGGDHTIATKADTTIRAIEQALDLLKTGGFLSLCIYSGGDSGFEEKDAVLDYIGQLNAKEYDVIVCEFYNKPNHPPLPVFIHKKK